MSSLSPVDDVFLRVMDSGHRVASLVEVVWGFKHTGEQREPPAAFSDAPADGLVRFMRHQSALRPYALTEQDWLGSHGHGQGRYWKRGTGPGPYPANWGKYEAPKVFISVSSNRNANEQLVAAVDRHGVYPGKHFVVLTLHADWRRLFRQLYPGMCGAPGEISLLRWLCSILNSPVGHAWIARNAAPRGARADACTALPLPGRYDPQIARLLARLERVKRPGDLGRHPTWAPPARPTTQQEDLFPDSGIGQRQAGRAFWDTVREINSAVCRSYGLTEGERRSLDTFLQSMTDPWAEHGPDVAHLPPNTKLRVVRGKTVRVDVVHQTMQVELSWRSLGNAEPVRIPIPKFMPGWALEEGREFTCRAPAGCPLVRVQNEPWLLRDFRAVPYSYLGKEALEGMIGYATGGGDDDAS